MIAQPQWFARRKYLGWGLYPKTWQGWVYIAVMIALLVIMSFVPTVSAQTVQTVTLIWVGLCIVDIADVMVRMNKDEREKIHEAFAERNALWVMLAILVVAIGYQASQSIVKTGAPTFDPFIIAAIFAGLIAKAITNIYLDRKD